MVAMPASAVRRNKTPLLTEQERKECYGGIIPQYRRKSLMVQQRHAAGRLVPKMESFNAYSRGDIQLVSTRHTSDDMDGDASTSAKAPIPMRSRKTGNRRSFLLRHTTAQLSHRDQPMPRQSRYHWFLPAGCGALALVTIYTVFFWVIFGYIALTNLLNYGPTHTSHLDTVLGTQQAHLVASNVHGTIYITIITREKRTTMIKTYTGPVLTQSSWGDLDAIVPTIEVQKVKAPAMPVISIHLVGNPNYWHFFARPSFTFTLVPDKAGYQVVSL